jgi:hypothetical protein
MCITYHIYFLIFKGKKNSLFYGKISMSFPSFVLIKVFIIINNYLLVQSLTPTNDKYLKDKKKKLIIYIICIMNTLLNIIYWSVAPSKS